MPDDKNGDSPAGYSKAEMLLPTEREIAVEQRILALEAQSNPCKYAPIGNDAAEDIKSGERWLIGINGLALLASIGIGIIYICQLKQMRYSNDLTRQALKDSAQGSLTAAAQFQAQLRHYDDGLGRTGLLAIHAGNQAEASKIAANAATRAAATAQQQLDSSERPWMLVRPRLALLPNEPSPVYFDPSGNLHVGIVIDAQNVGKSPAVKLRAVSKLIPGTSQAVGESEQRKMCDEAHLPDKLVGEGDTVFAAVPYQTPQYLTLNADTITAELANPSNNSFTMPNGRRLFMVGDNDMIAGLVAGTSKLMGGQTAPSISIIGCMDYSIDYSSRRLQTMFLYRLDGVDFRTHDTKNSVIGMNSGWGNKAN